MTIQEVSRLTGLSDKTIRYYETEGLIVVKRKANGYRSYTQDNIKTLNTIALLRYLTLSIQDVKNVLDNHDLWGAVYSKLQEAIKVDKRDLEHKELVLKSLRNSNYEEISENSEGILASIGDEYIKAIDSFSYPSLFDTIILTLILLGPILWMVVSVYSNVTINMKLALPLSLISMVLITLGWRKYHVGKAYQSKKANTFVSLVLLLVVIAVAIGSLVALSFGQGLLYTNSETLSYVSNHRFLMFGLLFLVMFESSTLIFGYRNKFTEQKSVDDQVYFFRLFKKHWKWVVLANIILVYIAFSSTTVINVDGSLVRYTPFKPSGKHYNVSDIKEVRVGYNTGFFKQYKNDFSMILVTDDFKVDIVEANVTKEGDTYFELVLLDNIYRSSRINKVLGNTNPKHCTYDKVYCDRFERIMKTKD